MFVHPNPLVLSALARQRRDEFLAEAERSRKARCATGERGDLRWRWSDIPAVVAMVAVLWLLAAVVGAA